MALDVSKVVPKSPILAKRVNSHRVFLNFSTKKGSSAEELQSFYCKKPVTFVACRRSSTVCFLAKSQDTETKPHEDLPKSQTEGEKEVMPSQVLVDGIMRFDARARQDVAILGSGFLKLDARAREDTEKIDRDVKRKAERLHHIASIFKNIAQSKLKNAADKHWSDGALEADLRLADFRAKQRAMEDALMALEFIKNIHDIMVDSLVISETGTTGRISLEKNREFL